MDAEEQGIIHDIMAAEELGVTRNGGHELTRRARAKAQLVLPVRVTQDRVLLMHVVWTCGALVQVRACADAEALATVPALCLLTPRKRVRVAVHPRPFQVISLMDGCAMRDEDIRHDRKVQRVAVHCDGVAPQEARDEGVGV